MNDILFELIEEAEDKNKDLLKEPIDSPKETKKEFEPVYGIVVSYNKTKLRNDGTEKEDVENSYTNINKLLKTITHGDNYSHALVSFDDSLTKMYSYDGKKGFHIDNIQENKIWLGTESIYICVMFVPKDDKKRMLEYIKKLEDDPEHAVYSAANLIQLAAPYGKTSKVDKRFVCSSFVGYILAYSDPKNLHRDYSRIRPEDVTILPRSFYVANIKDKPEFEKRHSEIRNKVNSIYKEYYDEICDYNNHLPKLMLQDKVTKLKTFDKICDWVLSKAYRG